MQTKNDQCVSEMSFALYNDLYLYTLLYFIQYVLII